MIILIFIASVFIILAGIIKRFANSFGNKADITKKILAIAFLILLVLSLPTLYLLPKNKLSKGNIIEEELIKNVVYYDDPETLYDEGKLDTSSFVTKKSSHFKINSKDLFLASNCINGTDYIKVKKETNDGIIDVDIYTFKSGIGNTDTTAYQPTIKAALENNKLTISELQNNNKLKIYKFGRNITYSQFTNSDFDTAYLTEFKKAPVIVIKYPADIFFENENQY